MTQKKKQPKKEQIKVQLSKNDLTELLVVLKDFMTEEIFANFRMEINHRMEIFNLRIVDLEKAGENLEQTHKWEHGDVFKTSVNNIMIYLKFTIGPPRTVCIHGPTGGMVEQKNIKNILQDAKFLFNIKEKL